MKKPKIIRVFPKRDYSVEVIFKDGKVAEYFMKDKINKGEYKQLKDIDVFLKAQIINNTLGWRVDDEIITIALSTLYFMAK